jgi:restriction endonuclease S subunit
MVTFSDVCLINPKKSEIADFNRQSEVSFVPMADINENKVCFQAKQKRNLEDVYKGYTYFRDNDVVFAKVTPCFENGKAGIVQNLINGIGFGSSELFVLRATEQILPQWIYYAIKTEEFMKNGELSMTGTGGLQRVSKDFVANFRIPLPPLDIQKEIVAEIEVWQMENEELSQKIKDNEKRITDKIESVWGE